MASRESMTEPKVTKKSNAQSVRESEARSIEAGAVRMPGGLLPPDAAAALVDLLDAGYANSKNGVISKALIEARKRRKK